MDAQCLILVTLTPQASIDTMLTDLSHGLRQMGVFTRVLLDLPQAPNHALVRGLIGDLRQAKGLRFIIDINAKTDFPIAAANGGTISIHDAWDIPRLSFFESNPLHHAAYLAKSPQNQFFSVIDPAHLQSLAELGIGCRDHVVCPHAGPDPVEQVANSAGRDIDILFIGNLGAISSHADWLSMVAMNDQEAAIVNQAFESHWHGGMAGLAEIKAASAAQSQELPLSRRVELSIAIESRANALHRRDALMAIRSAPVHVMGSVHPSHALPENAIRLGPQSFATALAHMDRAKLLLNFMPFRDGAHERIFYGLSRGACAVSDRSNLLAAEADHAEGGVIFRQPPHHLDEQLTSLLAEPKQLNRRRDHGRHWYAAEHRWIHRAQDIMGMLTKDNTSNT